MNISFLSCPRLHQIPGQEPCLSQPSTSHQSTHGTRTHIHTHTHTNTHTHTHPQAMHAWNLSIRIWQHLNDTYKGHLPHVSGFPGSSAGREFACNTGDPSSIPGLGRSPGEGTGHPLQYSWAFLVAQTVKNLLAVRETWVQSLGWEDPLEEVMATHSSILA